jgi:hypothetical protein
VVELHLARQECVLGVSSGAPSQAVCAVVPAKGVVGRLYDLKRRDLKTPDEKGK